jgi:hypothetical protein
MAGTNHATGWNRRTWTAFEESITGTTQNTQRRRHAQSLDKDPLQLPRPTLAAEQERSLKYQKEHPHPVPQPVRCNSTGIGGTKRNLRGFSRTGRRVAMNHKPGLKSFREFRKIRRVARTNELNKAHVGKKCAGPYMLISPKWFAICAGAARS